MPQDFTDRIAQGFRDAKERAEALSRERLKLGLDLRQKFELYFVALAFTVAGLAVQSAKPTGQNWVAIVEIAAWILLAIAGSVGLWRVGQMWVVLVGVAEVREEAEKKDLERRERQIRRWSAPQFAIFALGMGCLMVSRGWFILGSPLK
jgi:hypothetical protein